MKQERVQPTGILVRSIRDSLALVLLDRVHRSLSRLTFCTLVSARCLHNVLRMLLLASKPLSKEPGTPIRFAVSAVV